MHALWKVQLIAISKNKAVNHTMVDNIPYSDNIPYYVYFEIEIKQMKKCILGCVAIFQNV